MAKLVLKVVAVAATIGGALLTAGVSLGISAAVFSGIAAVATIASSLIASKRASSERQATETTLTLGEHHRSALFGTAATAGGLLDAFNYGGKYGTDWEVLLIALVDHECQSLEGFFVKEKYVAFTGDGDVAGYGGALKVWWLPGTAAQQWPAEVKTNGVGWGDTNSNCAGICCVAVAYKADKPDAENPVWSGGRPSFRWVLKGKKCYFPSKDDTVSGATGPHRWNDPSTWEWTDNAAICRYNYQRGIYALNQIGSPDQLLLGRGLSEIEAPAARAIVWANICDEDVALKAGGTEKRYTVNGVIGAEESFIQAEEKFATAMAGVIMQPDGSIEVEPGHAKSTVAEFTDADILNLAAVRYEEFRGEADEEWYNMVIPRYVEPAQNYKLHGAPIRRVNADVTADGGLRQKTLALHLVTSGTQAQRCAEIKRRLGRLTATGQVPLGPRFVEVEEGDWIGWTSTRHFGGGRKVFRVESYSRSEKWHMTFRLREIAASINDWTPATDELDNGAEASNHAVPPAIGQPAANAWVVAAGTVASSSGTQPALMIAGASDDDYAAGIKFEYRKVGDPNWIDGGITPRTATNKVIAPIEGGVSYEVAISYIVDGEPGTRRIYGPVTSQQGTTTYPDGTPIRKATDFGAFPSLATSNAGDTHTDNNGVKWVREETVYLTDGLGNQLTDGNGNKLVDWPWKANMPTLDYVEDGVNHVRVTPAQRAFVDAVAADGVFSREEKRAVEREVTEAIKKPLDALVAKSIALGIGGAERATATAAYASLTTYLGTAAWLNFNVDTDIDRTVFKSKFTAMYTAQAALLAVIQGQQGATGATGPQGVVGPTGPNGAPTYIWIAYADNAAGTSNFTNGAPGARKYIGIAANKSSASESSAPADYIWSKYSGDDGATGAVGATGAQGNQGIQGPTGPNGQATYTWIAYADSADGATNFTNGTPGSRKYIGIAPNKTTATESTTAGDYSWSLIKGADGHFFDHKFIMSGPAPTTPSGDSPSGWADKPPEGNLQIWYSTAKKTFAGTLLTNWSIPRRWGSKENPRGVWNSSNTYYPSDTVQHGGGTYGALRQNTNKAPTGSAQDNADWFVIAAPGQAGTPATPPSGFTHTITLLTATGLQNLRTLADAAGYTGQGDATITANLASGQALTGAASTLTGGGAALTTGTWPSAHTISLTLNVTGKVYGGGGNGGQGETGANGGSVGGGGGDALDCKHAITVTVNSGGEIKAGGGGGGGGRGDQTGFGFEPQFYSGGGGGGGAPNGSGGGAGFGNIPPDASNGAGGTTSGGGAGGAAGTAAHSSAGGNGGTFASAGVSVSGGTTGGAAGYAIRKNGNTVTLTNNGTISGTQG